MILKVKRVSILCYSEPGRAADLRRQLGDPDLDVLVGELEVLLTDPVEAPAVPLAGCVSAVPVEHQARS